MHCPFYNSNKAHQDEQQATLMRDAHGFEDLFHQHKVAVVISGHVHAYERSHPVYKNTSQPGAPTYLVVGDGGNREGHASTYLDEPGWSAFRDGLSFGHGRLVIANQSHMRWEWYRNNKQQLPRVDRVTAVRRAAELAHSSFVPFGCTVVSATLSTKSGWWCLDFEPLQESSPAQTPQCQSADGGTRFCRCSPCCGIRAPGETMHEAARTLWDRKCGDGSRTIRLRMIKEVDHLSCFNTVHTLSLRKQKCSSENFWVIQISVHLCLYDPVWWF